MNSGTIVELIGYAGSVLVLVSMLMTSVIRLRVINLIGSVIFSIYALLIRSYPTAIMNICLAGINLYHLWNLMKVKKHYELVAADGRDTYLAYLLRKYEADIREWQPAFSVKDSGWDRAFLMCCDGNPAGVFLAEQTAPGELEVKLDYALPVYRDTSVGRFLHQSLAGLGVRRLVFRQDAPNHTDYLLKVGYQKKGEHEYVLDLTDAQ